ncbi:hypothetical protein ASG17_04310 [Brevundimonas sp. Leaf363]|uniref:hypothetical protein n=1 Tax=Brevundimonas sp. Leaf363 TaxID=1736353 RepID=UPI0006F5B2BC|nr:hypothetical protein [Brevundimonas sp. Leaf363]KQS55322.1 hypothetical protein ASG17_04310 [Brevundimonas sp. Leaf363]
MITNIIDRRTHPHRWRSIDAVAEATWHDNAANDSPNHDNATATTDGSDTFAVRVCLSVTEAIAWAQGFADEVTLYLYDAGAWESDWV